ncbi:MAG: RNA polymerase sigma factor [Chloroflexota bacterium]|nr:RNA polymerase sigma factor [Chloroflexota bacterium]MDP9472399.1 RNA polymerase sigma factor [Chloroflexota bacterium]
MTFPVWMTLEWSGVLVAAPGPECGSEEFGHGSPPGVRSEGSSPAARARAIDDVGEPAELADHSLVAAARDGDRRAFETLVDRHHPPLLRRLTRQTGDPDLAADLVQETFLSALRRLGQLAVDDAFVPWLYRIAQNHLRMEYRRRRRRPTIPLDWITSREIGISQAGKFEPVLATEPSDDFVRALDGLSATLREALLLHRVQGYHASEIARILGISPAAALKRISRADAQFRAIYRDLQPPEQAGAPDRSREE